MSTRDGFYDWNAGREDELIDAKDSAREADIDAAIRSLDAAELLSYYTQTVDALGAAEKARFMETLRDLVAKDCL